jgi:hypothetical protein
MLIFYFLAIPLKFFKENFEQDAHLHITVYFKNDFHNYFNHPRLAKNAIILPIFKYVQNFLGKTMIPGWMFVESLCISGLPLYMFWSSSSYYGVCKKHYKM